MNPHDLIIRTQEPILLNVLEGFPHKIQGIPEINKYSSWISSGNRMLARVYLTYITKMLFNIQLAPFHEEKYQRWSAHSDAIAFMAHVTSEMLNTSMIELKRLYDHTQEVLNGNYLDNRFKDKKQNGKIKLKRGIFADYAHAMAAHKLFAQQNNIQWIPIPTYILSSYACGEAYAGDVEFSFDVPIENILLSSCTVALSGAESYFTTFDEEFIVINNNPKGLIYLNIEDINFIHNYQESNLHNLIADRLYSDRYFANTYPLPNLLHEFSPTAMREPYIVNVAKWLCDMYDKYKKLKK